MDGLSIDGVWAFLLQVLVLVLVVVRVLVRVLVRVPVLVFVLLLAVDNLMLAHLANDFMSS